MIEVEVSGTFLVNVGKDFVILLKNQRDERTLPISIGRQEAQSIAIHLNKVPFPRPLTHDLFKSLIDESDLRFIRTEICELKDDTFYAKLVLERGGETVEIDSRPSDAIAIALRLCAPIYVDELVMDKAGIIMPDEDNLCESESESEQEPELVQKPEFLLPETETEQSRESVEALLTAMTPLEALQKQLERAVREERYEEAVSLRDQIKNFTQPN